MQIADTAEAVVALFRSLLKFLKVFGSLADTDIIWNVNEHDIWYLLVGLGRSAILGAILDFCKIYLFTYLHN